MDETLCRFMEYTAEPESPNRMLLARPSKAFPIVRSRRTLGLAVYTVKNYLFKIFDKLGVSNRVELVLFCLCQEKAAHEEAVVHLTKSVTQLGAPRNTTKHETECKLGTATFGSLNSTTRARQKLCRIL